MHEETASDKGKGRQEPHLTKDQIKYLQVSSNKQTKWYGVIWNERYEGQCKGNWYKEEGSKMDTG